MNQNIILYNSISNFVTFEYPTYPIDFLDDNTMHAIYAFEQDQMLI
jgi:hypothetical protein